MTSGSTIERVEAWTCRVPIDRPVQLGDVRVERRDFVLVRVTTRDGLSGCAYALSRGAPVDLVVSDLLAPLVLGRDALDIPQRVAECQRAMITLGTVGIVARALSLLDICLWDIKAHVAGLPLWRLLGGSTRRAAVMLVAPYAHEAEPDREYAERLAELAGSGYRILKLYPMADPAAMARRLATIRDVLGDAVELVVDMAWTWRRAADAIAAIRLWEPLRLTWVEDPMPVEYAEQIRNLSDAVTTPIAVGDDVSVPAHFEGLLARRAVDVLRLDATTIGGISGFDHVRHLASEAGYQVSPHAYAEIHQHCVFAWPDVVPIETFPPRSSTWGAHHLLLREGVIPDADGAAAAPERPGLGLDVDWEAVQRFAIRSAERRTDTSG